MKGHLQLSSPDGPLELRARVVRLSTGTSTLFSWHGRLAPYRGFHGRLLLDDDGMFDVVVRGGYLEVVSDQP
ncbi:MAG TPA: hypothetical protein VGF22_16995 [Acidimicrobiales bacterium]|jgi:hypothetical protein